MFAGLGVLMVTLADGSYKQIPMADMGRSVRPLNPPGPAQPHPQAQVAALAKIKHEGQKGIRKRCIEHTIQKQITDGIIFIHMCVAR